MFSRCLRFGPDKVAITPIAAGSRPYEEPTLRERFLSIQIRYWVSGGVFWGVGLHFYRLGCGC